MIALNLYDHEIDLVKRALAEFRDRELSNASIDRNPHLYEAQQRNAERAKELFERLLFSEAA